MRPTKTTSGERTIKDIERKTRKQYSGRRRSASCWMGFAAKTALLSCAAKKAYPKAFISASLPLGYKWSKDFLEAGKKRLAGDIVRQANTSEVKGLRSEAREFKECVAELTLENRLLTSALLG